MTVIYDTPPNRAAVKRLVAKVMNISVEDINSLNRAKKYILARQMVIKVYRDNFCMTWKDIAAHVGTEKTAKHWSTCIHALRVLNQMLYIHDEYATMHWVKVQANVEESVELGYEVKVYVLPQNRDELLKYLGEKGYSYRVKE